MVQEAHLIHEFDDDFYGSELSVVIVGYIRDEQSFASLGCTINIDMLTETDRQTDGRTDGRTDRDRQAKDQINGQTDGRMTDNQKSLDFLCCFNVEALIAAIHSDINQASITLDRVDKFRKIKNSPFFKPDPTEEKTTDKT